MARAAPRIPRAVAKSARRPNGKLDRKHREFVRSLPCICCGATVNIQAAHVRMSSAEHDKFNAMGTKPADKYCVPLCGRCHLGDQHSKYGEPAFWSALGIDPLDVSLRLWAVTGDTQQGLRAISRARQAIEVHRCRSR